MKLGTILPTERDMAINEAVANRQRRDRERAGRKLFKGCQRREVGGEVRWYATATIYGVVNFRLEPCWFEVRADGDYAISRYQRR